MKQKGNQQNLESKITVFTACNLKFEISSNKKVNGRTILHSFTWYIISILAFIKKQKTKQKEEEVNWEVEEEKVEMKHTHSSCEQRYSDRLLFFSKFLKWCQRRTMMYHFLQNFKTTFTRHILKGCCCCCCYFYYRTKLNEKKETPSVWGRWETIEKIEMGAHWPIRSECF